MRRMGQRILKRIDLTAARKRMAERGGFTLAEMMAAMLIMLIASGLIAQTMAFAVQQTKKQYDVDKAERIYAETVAAVREKVETAQSANFLKDALIVDGEPMTVDNHVKFLDFDTFPPSDSLSDSPSDSPILGFIITIRVTVNSEVVEKPFVVIPVCSGFGMSEGVTGEVTDENPEAPEELGD